MLTLTFTGDTLKDVMAQMGAVALALSAPSDAAVAAKTVEVNVVKTETVKTEEKKPAKEVATKTATEAADPAKLKEEALRVLRRKFAEGKEGAAAVLKLREKYGVKKFETISDDQIAALHRDATAL